MRPSILLPVGDVTSVLLINSKVWHYVEKGTFYISEQAVYFSQKAEHHIRQPHYHFKDIHKSCEMFGPVSSIAAIRT